MANLGTIVACRVKEGSQTILDWFAFQVKHGETFAGLFEMVVDASHQATPGARFKHAIDLKESSYTKCTLSSKPLDPTAIEVAWNLSVESALSTFNCNHVTFEIVKKEHASSTDAFAELYRKYSHKHLYILKGLGLNQSLEETGNSKMKFISTILEENKFGLRKGEESVGKSIVNSVCDVLYYLLPHLSTIKARYISIPDLFRSFAEARVGLNDPTMYKNKIKPLDKQKLQEFSQGLYRVITFPCFALDRLKSLKIAILDLASQLDRYVDYLGSQNKRSLDLHNLPHPARSPSDGVSTRLKQIPGQVRPENTVKRYTNLEKYLLETDEYIPVSLTDFYPPDRRKRYTYVNELQMPFDVTYYHYSSGGPTEDLYFVWKCSNVLDLCQANKVIHEIEQNIKIYHSRAMRKEFSYKFGLICKVSPTVLNEMYMQLTNDASAISSTVSKQVHCRLRVLLDSENPDLVVDMRSLNGDNDTKFDAFFGEVEKFLNEFELQAVDDRRHGLITHTAVAISVRDLHQQITARLPEGTPVPSLEYLRLQFMPKNSFLATATQYTGRFPLTFRIQSRQFNMFPVDAHYASALQNYLKCFAVKFRKHCVLLSVDDKNHIPVGEPGVPIATIYRSRKSVAHANILNMSSDHDTSAKLKLTPSVAIQVNVPDNTDGDFYNGQVCVTIKDTIFQPSTPFRHVAEMRQTLEKAGQLQQPIRLVYSDGGPDNRVTYPSVKLALISMFLTDDLDYLVTMRTAPHQSYINWVERIMSILNLALQTVAIERQAMEQEFENVMKSLATMNSIRAKCATNADLKEALQNSAGPVIDCLNTLFSRLQLKDVPFITTLPASCAEIDQLWDALHSLDPTVQRTDTQTKQIMKREKLRAFMDHCTMSRKYFFLIKKCGQPNCTICKSPRLDPSIFDSLHAIPDPEPSVDVPSKFKTFDESYGHQTTDKYCPSEKQLLLTRDADSVQLPQIKMTAETVRDFLCVLTARNQGVFTPLKAVQ